MNSYPLLDLESIRFLLKERFNGNLLSLKDLPDPSCFKDMNRAVKRIIQGISQNERIILIGDYDVDGVVSTSIMRLFFDMIKSPLKWIIPNRFHDGYGLSSGLLERIGFADLIITVDNGISAYEAAKICTRRGIDLIITDHHIVPKTLPEAYAIVNQKQPDCSFPYKEVCGAQIAWYLCAALRRALNLPINMCDFLEYVSLAIIADIMPLQHINRTMVQTGLRLLSSSNKAFIRVYREATAKEIFTVEDIAFGLAPLINSAGRIEEAAIASDYLCAKNIYDARSLLATLQGYNERRKSLEQNITEEVIASIKRDPAVIIAAGEKWHEGVLGIVAARLANRFQRPALVLTEPERGYKGSGRSFGDCDLFGLDSGAREYLEKFGGHRAAVGLSLSRENLPPFRKKLEKLGDNCRDSKYRDPAILGILPAELIDQDLYELLEAFEPFGYGNPRPKFISFWVRIKSLRRIGAEGQHMRFLFQVGERLIDGIEFRSFGHYISGAA